MIRFGLCCIFRKAPIKFRRITAKHLEPFSRETQLDKIAEICRHNAGSLQKALRYCRDHHIKGFRINSRILPIKTHPNLGYAMKDLPGHGQIIQRFKGCGGFCEKQDIRTSFHPDPFILLSSPRDEVVEGSVVDLIYHAEVAQWVNADVINIHGGGAYGDKHNSLYRLRKNIERLPGAVRSRLTLENDDRVYTPKDLLPVCKDMGIPLVYDVHHHRCLPDGISIEKTTEQVLATWNREPLFHISSPKNSWKSSNPRDHHDYIDAADFPECWMELDITVEVEAKAKELAVLELKRVVHGLAEKKSKNL
jgi:UV DNA damage endonuclease